MSQITHKKKADYEQTYKRVEENSILQKSQIIFFSEQIAWQEVTAVSRVMKDRHETESKLT